MSSKYNRAPSFKKVGALGLTAVALASFATHEHEVATDLRTLADQNNSAQHTQPHAETKANPLVSDVLSVAGGLGSAAVGIETLGELGGAIGSAKLRRREQSLPPAPKPPAIGSR